MIGKCVLITNEKTKFFFLATFGDFQESLIYGQQHGGSQAWEQEIIWHWLRCKQFGENEADQLGPFWRKEQNAIRIPWCEEELRPDWPGENGSHVRWDVLRVGVLKEKLLVAMECLPIPSSPYPFLRIEEK